MLESEKPITRLKPTLPPHETTKHLSDLCDDLLIHILSFLPTRLAVRTSVLSRRFRHLWETCSLLELHLIHLSPSYTYSTFINISERCLLYRNPPSPLRHLQIFLPVRWTCLPLGCSLSYDDNLVPSIEYISSLLIKARSFRLCHLTIQAKTEYMTALFPVILSIPSLEILSLIDLDTITDSMVPSMCISNSIRSMSIEFSTWTCVDSAALNRFLSQLHVLEDLELSVERNLDLCSHTVKRLKLRGMSDCPQVRLSIPSLEVLDIRNGCFLRKFSDELPSLKTALIKVVCLKIDRAVCEILKTVANVEHLDLDISEYWNKYYPFHTLVKPGMEPPKFPNLKHFHLTASFHEYNLKDLGTLLKNSSVLQSLKLNNKPVYFFTSKSKIQRIHWRPELHGNDEGNKDYCYYNNLHISAEKIKLLKLLDKEVSFKEVDDLL